MTESSLAELLKRIERGNRIARITMRAVLALDIAIGMAWTFADPNRAATPVFTIARHVFDGFGIDPSRVWGAILLVLAVATLAAMHGKSELATRMLLVTVTGYWVFWFVLDIISAFAPRGSWSAAPTVGIVIVGHVRGAVGTHLLTRRAVALGE